MWDACLQNGGSYQADNLDKLMNDICEHAIDMDCHEPTAPQISELFFENAHGTVATCSRDALHSFTLKLDDLLAEYKRDYDEGVAGQEDLRSEYYSNLL